MEAIFIKEIKIEKVRHLQDVTIKIADSERKHLIITGKNGSGKTSILNAIRDNLVGIENGQLFQIPQRKNNVALCKQRLDTCQKQFESSIEERNRVELRSEIERINYCYDAFSFCIKFNQQLRNL